MPNCPVCGHCDWKHVPTIWPALAEQWNLNAEELEYVDRQQGTRCARCGGPVRVAALADAIRSHYGWRRPLREMILRRPWLKVLEINEAGTLTPTLRRYRHTLAMYPEVDAQALPYTDASFDLVVHSDTLEHVPDPGQALRECRRVLRAGGALAYTVPVVVGRMGRVRGPDEVTSYHGGEATSDYPVVTEYGADMWTAPVRAGFSSVTVKAFDYPAGLSMLCKA